MIDISLDSRALKYYYDYSFLCEVLYLKGADMSIKRRLPDSLALQRYGQPQYLSGSNSRCITADIFSGLQIFDRIGTLNLSWPVRSLPQEAELQSLLWSEPQYPERQK